MVNNRVFLLGLDQLYREAMKGHERGELLAAARRVAETLGQQPASVPVEGYYAEEPELTEYFKLMRALQTVPLDRAAEVARLAEFKRLLEVTSSPMFGRAVREHLLPLGRDPLSAALQETRPWTVPALVACASRVARETDDWSLVGLAARAEDPVVLAALRESVVLYAEEGVGAALERIEYEWSVDPELAAAAKRFVDEFNRVMGSGLPQPTARFAWAFWSALGSSEVAGRCVCLGRSPDTSHFYHWAVVQDAEGALGVHEFWADRICTTQEYRSSDVGGSVAARRAATDARLRALRQAPGYHRDDFR